MDASEAIVWKKLLWVAWLLAPLTSAGPPQVLKLVTLDYPPMTVVQGDKLSGIVYDAVGLVFARAGYAHQVELVPWKRAMALVETGTVSCVFPMTRTSEREARFSWVGPFLTGAHVLVALESNPIQLTNPAQARNYRIGVLAGSAVEQTLKTMGLPYFGDPKSENNMRKLSEGMLDLWAVHDVVAQYESRDLHVPIKQLLKLATVETYLGCRLDTASDVLNALQNQLDKLKQQGELTVLQQQYLSTMSSK
ncbi:ABC transporter substrate-binding protein [Chitinivorax sp. B]|uniref:substrate-binding periplasmic protein n=1 Tax=Chitinivorax sp. B TaxID=2502235 RepID=UPI0010F87E7F|nr:ABC transporter substrate-binding protein [Chitinivorax sp. B]